ncbi:MAG: flagellar biosynthetic protein FliO, partial [Deltaproteobacteria bacterium]|nr:flagellar biosynthetic protein FliO [Nannocystaceae bacterium]
MPMIAASGAWVLVEVGLLLGLVTGLLMWLGKRARTTDPSVMRTIRLSPQHAVYVIAIEDRRLLIGVGPTSSPELICDLADKPKGARVDIGPIGPVRGEGG